MPPEYTLLRSRRRTLALIIEADGSLTVRAPMRMTRAAIQDFVTQKADWIHKTQTKVKARADGKASHHFQTGELFPYLGHLHPLTIVPAQRPALKLDEAGFRLSQSAQPRARQYFEAWYKQQARAYLQTRVDHFAALHSLKFHGLRISSARTRWGSCSHKNDLSFTWRLILAPPEVVDYVILHELAHTVQHNHGPKFWSLVESLMPDYKNHLRWLKQNGHSLNLD
jgi:predicted metal-dependent hydrolase